MISTMIPESQNFFLSSLLVLLLISINSNQAFSDESKFVFSGKEIEISTDFDNGWLARVEETETNVFELWPYDFEHYKWDWVYLESMTRTSWYDNTGFCFHFRISGCKDKKITFSFHVKVHTRDENAITVLYANPDFPVLSYDEENWWRTDNKSLVTDPADRTVRFRNRCLLRSKSITMPDNG